MNHRTALVRYQVLAANRRHFGNQYLAVVAFSWALALAVWTVMRWTRPGLPLASGLGAGAVLIAGAFVAHRLLLRERSAFQAMCACWLSLSGERQTVTPKAFPGAMALVALGQSAVGVVLPLFS